MERFEEHVVVDGFGNVIDLPADGHDERAREARLQYTVFQRVTVPS